MVLHVKQFNPFPCRFKKELEVQLIFEGQNKILHREGQCVILQKCNDFMYFVF